MTNKCLSNLSGTKTESFYLFAKAHTIYFTSELLNFIRGVTSHFESCLITYQLIASQLDRFASMRGASLDCRSSVNKI